MSLKQHNLSVWVMWLALLNFVCDFLHGINNESWFNGITFPASSACCSLFLPNTRWNTLCTFSIAEALVRIRIQNWTQRSDYKSYPTTKTIINRIIPNKASFAGAKKLPTTHSQSEYMYISQIFASCNCRPLDDVAEWLRRRTANPL
jgi:hypothetical protein